MIVFQVFRSGGFWLKIETPLFILKWEGNPGSTVVNVRQPDGHGLGNMLLLRVYSR
jgi:hypothetical protein